MCISNSSFNTQFGLGLCQRRRRCSLRGLMGAVLLGVMVVFSGGEPDRIAFGLAPDAAAMGSRARDPGPAGRVALTVAELEKEEFMVRADVWERAVEPEIGKALRVQLFKGHSYVIVALPVVGDEGSVEANVIDGTGQAVEQRNREWRGATRLEFTPAATGLYVVLVRNTSDEPVTAAVVVGYK